jgi:hypothetical protein
VRLSFSQESSSAFSRKYARLSFVGVPSSTERSGFMTIVPLTQASVCLGIDVKTLRRWLAQAQLPLHCHPQDGRKKGLSEEHLHLLARLHQRRLAPLASEPAAPAPGALPTLPAGLLALPEQLSALQTQIAALQQQLSALTRLLEPQRQAPAIPAVPLQPSRRSKRSPKPAAAQRARPAASATTKTPRQPAHVIPRVEYGREGRYVVICPKQGVLPFEPETQEWFAWVATQASFRFVGQAGHFTAHHEWRVRKKGAWRAHRHIRNHVSIQRLAPTHELTIAVLEQAAAALQAHLL